MEFEGAVRDEIGCYEGGTAWIKGDRVMDVPVGVSDKPIKAVWCGGETDDCGNEITWTYETEIPHETFMIYEGEEPFCRGIVFNINDLD